MHTEEQSNIDNFVLSKAQNICVLLRSIILNVKSPLPPSLCAVLFLFTGAAFVQC